MSRVLEITIDGPQNDNVLFPPLQASVRGRFAFHRVAEPYAGAKRDEWGDEFPGQCLGLDLDSGDAYLADPLYEDKHLDCRQRLERHKFRLPPPVERFPKVNVPAWLSEFKRLLDAGLARITKGSLPEKVEKLPRSAFFGATQQAAPAQEAASMRAVCQQQAEQIRQQGEQINRLLSALGLLAQPQSGGKQQK